MCNNDALIGQEDILNVVGLSLQITRFLLNFID
jgi:hypothetical protein